MFLTKQCQIIFSCNYEWPPRTPEMRSSFHQLLVALAVVDTLYVITSIVDYSMVKVLIISATATTMTRCLRCTPWPTPWPSPTCGTR